MNWLENEKVKEERDSIYDELDNNFCRFEGDVLGGTGIGLILAPVVGKILERRLPKLLSIVAEEAAKHPKCETCEDEYCLSTGGVNRGFLKYCSDHTALTLQEDK